LKNAVKFAKIKHQTLTLSFSKHKENINKLNWTCQDRQSLIYTIQFVKNIKYW